MAVVAGNLGEAKPRVATPHVRLSFAPHLVATVLVARGDFAARYPDAVRRLLRGLLDANAQVIKAPEEAARALMTVAPKLGDPHRGHPRRSACIDP